MKAKTSVVVFLQLNQMKKTSNGANERQLKKEIAWNSIFDSNEWKYSQSYSECAAYVDGKKAYVNFFYYIT